MIDQKTNNDESAQDPSAETGAQDMTGSDKAANDGVTDDILNDVLAEADAETKGDVETQDPLTAMIAERDQLKDQLLRALADTENMVCWVQLCFMLTQ